METPKKPRPLGRANPLHDYIFYRVMGQKGDEVQLLGFLNAVICRSGKEQIASVEIREDKTFIKEIKNGKSCVLDLLAVLDDGTRVNIEVQLDNQRNIDRRSLFYCGKVYLEGVKKGHDYRELPNVIAINIVGFDFPQEGNLHTCFHLREDNDPSLVLPALEVHFINMVKWGKTKGRDLKDDPLHRWLALFDQNSPPELLEEVAKMDMAIMAAKERLEYVEQDEETYELYWKHLKMEMDARGRLAYAHDEGLVEGIEQGLAQGIEQGRAEGLRQGYNEKLEIARKMKGMGLPIAQIAEVTGLAPQMVETL